jgi:hypothetical protein
VSEIYTKALCTVIEDLCTTEYKRGKEQARVMEENYLSRQNCTVDPLPTCLSVLVQTIG